MTRFSLGLVSVLVLVALLPSAAGARTIAEQTELGKVRINESGISLKPDRASIRRGPVAQAAGSSVGRIPRCKAPNPRSIRKPKQFERFLLCVVKEFGAALSVVDEFLLGATAGDGTLACPLVTETERIRLGGVTCPQRIEAGSAGLAAREPRLREIFFGKTKPGSHGEAIVILRHPRDALLLELLVAPHRYWRLSDVGDLFP